MHRLLVAIPIYNEAQHLERVLAEVRRYAEHILVVNDGSTDETAGLLSAQRDLHVITHPTNRGYGGAIISAMGYALAHRYQFETLITMDCDGQHEPARIPVLSEALSDGVDIVSGSRYLRTFKKNDTPPADRQRINEQVTAELNLRFGLNITDAFCGFKAYRVPTLGHFCLTETGWGMPLQLWVQAAHLRLRIVEVALPRIYLDPNRAFGGMLDDPGERLNYYREIIDREASHLEALTGRDCC
jgi:dolichol-phosphate mannosyltransferase